jgi:Tol biopolymer transport system component
MLRNSLHFAITALIGLASTAEAQHEGRKQDFHPSVSPDGTQAVFYSYREPNFPDLFLVNLATGEATNLSNTDDLWEIEPEWSPVANRVAYSRGPSMGSLDVVVQDLDSGEVTTFGPGINVSWAPDGRRIVWTRDGEFHIADVDTGTVHTVNSIDVDGQVSEPAWAANDHTLVFMVGSGGEDNNERFDVFWHDMETGEIRQLTDNANQETHPRMINDGATLIFAGAYESREPSLYRMDLETGALGRLFTEELASLYTYFPSVGPDGSTIYFEAGDWSAGRFDLYAVPSDGSDVPRALSAP